MAIKIKENKNFQGLEIKLKMNTLSISQIADDTTTFLQ